MVIHCDLFLCHLYFRTHLSKINRIAARLSLDSSVPHFYFAKLFLDFFDLRYSGQAFVERNNLVHLMQSLRCDLTWLR